MTSASVSLPSGIVRPANVSDRYPMTVILSAAASRRLVLNVSVALLVATAACSDGGKRTASSPTSPSASVDGATSDTAGADGSSGPASEDVIQRTGLPGSGLKGSRNVSQAVEFPPRDGTLQFRQQLEAAYRDALGRSPSTSFVDIEGTIVWTRSICATGSTAAAIRTRLPGSRRRFRGEAFSRSAWTSPGRR